MNPVKQQYIALVKSGAVRDVQICTDAACDPVADTWYDFSEAELYIGLYEGPTAAKDAAKYALTVPENIRLISINPS